MRSTARPEGRALHCSLVDPATAEIFLQICPSDDLPLQEPSSESFLQDKAIGVAKSICDSPAASGDQDHTTSPSALVAPVLRATCVHRIPLPTSVTIAKRPSCGAGPPPYRLN